MAGLTFAGLLALVGAVLLTLCGTGLVRVFAIPNRGMSPALNPGDQIVMERLSYLSARPKRGDIIVFKAGKFAGFSSEELWVKRLIGLPGDRLHLSKGIISINDQQVHFYNRAGEIRYVDLPFTARHLANDFDVFAVPEGHYFVIGDNSGNSADSRIWGALPASSVIGRVVFCCLPGDRMGRVK